MGLGRRRTCLGGGSHRGRGWRRTVNFVCTHPGGADRGTAACVSALSALLLATEADTCVLYAQLANPISNGAYRSIGYGPGTEILVYRFGTGTAPPGGPHRAPVG